MRARQLTTVMLLDRQMKTKIDKEVSQLLLSIISGAGGFRVLIEDRSVKSLLKELRQMDATLRYVVEIVRYLVRCRSHEGDPERATIEDAKAFVRLSQIELGLSTYGASKISKIWEDFKPAAPYLFAVFEERGFRPIKAKNPDSVLDWLIAFTSRQCRVMRLLGRAASAMDVLRHISRGQRILDFGGIERVPLRSRPFTERERSTISRIDHKSPIDAPYRPKQKLLKRVHIITG